MHCPFHQNAWHTQAERTYYDDGSKVWATWNNIWATTSGLGDILALWGYSTNGPTTSWMYHEAYVHGDSVLPGDQDHIEMAGIEVYHSATWVCYYWYSMMPQWVTSWPWTFHAHYGGGVTLA